MVNKLKFQVLFLLIFNGLLTVNAQEAQIKVSTRVNSDNSVGFIFDKSDPGTFTLQLNLRDLSNAISQTETEQTFNLKSYQGNFFTLKPENKEYGVGYAYSYHFIRGKLKPKYDPGFIYLLPHKLGTKVQMAEASFLDAQYFGNKTPDDWKCYSFYTKQEDSVTAVRKGVVVQIKDEYDAEVNEGVAYTSRNNELMIEHADGTIAVYRGLKKGSLSVKVGQTVLPGRAIGLNAKNGSAHSITFLLIYLKSNDIEASRNQNLKNSKSFYGFVTPHFFTEGNPDLVLSPKEEYTAAANPELIKKELTKKELKQLLK